MAHTRSFSFQTFSLFISVLSLLSFVVSCTPDADPFRVRSTPTPDPNATVPPLTSASTTAANLSVLNRNPDLVGKGTIRFANSGVNTTAFGSTLTGYVIVWGYGYSVELVDTQEMGYQKAMDDGKVDMVIEVSKSEAAEWYNSRTSAGKVSDVGSLYSPTSDKRIVVTADVKQNAPDLVDFFKKLSLGDETVTNIAAGMTGGRTGVTPAVATLKYLKENEATWAPWTTTAVKEGVQAALASGKTSLRNRNCIPDGGSGNVGSPNC